MSDLAHELDGLSDVEQRAKMSQMGLSAQETNDLLGPPPFGPATGSAATPKRDFSVGSTSGVDEHLAATYASTRTPSKAVAKVAAAKKATPAKAAKKAVPKVDRERAAVADAIDEELAGPLPAAFDQKMRASDHSPRDVLTRLAASLRKGDRDSLASVDSALGSLAIRFGTPAMSGDIPDAAQQRRAMENLAIAGLAARLGDRVAAIRAGQIDSSGPRKAGRDLTSTSMSTLAKNALTHASEADSMDPYLSALARKQGFDGPPTVMSAQEMDRLIADGATPMFRGTTASTTVDGHPISAAKVNEQLRTGPAFYGSGEYGPGYYFSSYRSTMDDYSDGTPGSVAKAVLRPDARHVSLEDIEAQRSAYLKSVPADDWATESLLATPAHFAAAKGYDVVDIPNPDGGGAFHLVLNRTALVVEDHPTKAPRPGKATSPAKAAKKAVPKAAPVATSVADLDAMLADASEARLRAAARALRVTIPARSQRDVGDSGVGQKIGRDEIADLLATTIAGRQTRTGENWRQHLHDQLAKKAPAKAPRATKAAKAAPHPDGLDSMVKGGRRTEPFNPYPVYSEGGEAGLRSHLSTLSLEQLHDMVASNGMDPARRSANWKQRGRLEDLIVARVGDRAVKGQQFHPPSTPHPDGLDSMEPTALGKYAREFDVQTSGKTDAEIKAALRAQGVGSPDVEAAKRAAEDAAAPKVKAGPTLAHSEAQVVERIHAATRKLERRPGGWVSLTNLRAETSDIPREQLDRTLIRMSLGGNGMFVVPESNQKMLRQADRDAALSVGNQDRHVMRIEPHVSPEHSVRGIAESDREDAAYRARVAREEADRLGRAATPSRAVAKVTAARKAAPKAAAPAPTSVLGRLQAVGSEEEARQYLDGLNLSSAQLKDLAASLQVPLRRSGQSKAATRDDIVMVLVTGRLTTAAIGRF